MQMVQGCYLADLKEENILDYQDGSAVFIRSLTVEEGSSGESWGDLSAEGTEECNLAGFGDEKEKMGHESIYVGSL